MPTCPPCHSRAGGNPDFIDRFRIKYGMTNWQRNDTLFLSFRDLIVVLQPLTVVLQPLTVMPAFLCHSRAGGNLDFIDDKQKATMAKGGQRNDKERNKKEFLNRLLKSDSMLKMPHQCAGHKSYGRMSFNSTWFSVV